MPNTAEGFYYPDANTNIAPLEAVLANMAASSDAVSKQTPRVFANYAAMIAAIPAPTAGRLAVTTQGSGILWQYDGTAAKWVVQNTPTFTNTAAREAAIPNPTAGIECVTGSGATYSEWVHNGAAWRLRTGHWVGPYAASINPTATPPAILVRNGVATGTTTVGGVLVTEFAPPFPTACIGVVFMPNQNKSAPALVESSPSASGFHSFWAGLSSVAVPGIQYIAFGY